VINQFIGQLQCTVTITGSKGHSSIHQLVARYCHNSAIAIQQCSKPSTMQISKKTSSSVKVKN